jgi:hypothetical protein
MELLASEVKQLKSLIEEWSRQDNFELEASFKDAKDMTTFLSVAQRLKSKGYEEIAQEDKLNILTPEKVRFTITGMGLISEYCKDDTLAGKPFEAMIKDRNSPTSNLHLNDYGVFVKVMRELELKRDDVAVGELLGRWETQKKSFRLIRRWTFKGKGIRFDLSMVRSTKKTERGEYAWQTLFAQQQLGPQSYEIEVELDRPERINPSAPLTKEEEEAINTKSNERICSGSRRSIKRNSETPFLNP